MAIYEYLCEACDRTFVVTELISQHEKRSERRPSCPHCKSRRTRQLFSGFYAKTESKT